VSVLCLFLEWPSARSSLMVRQAATKARATRRPDTIELIWICDVANGANPPDQGKALSSRDFPQPSRSASMTRRGCPSPIASLNVCARQGFTPKLHREDLEGDGPLQARIAGYVDLAHPSLGEEADDLVAAEPCADLHYWSRVWHRTSKWSCMERQCGRARSRHLDDVHVRLSRRRGPPRTFRICPRPICASASGSTAER
jgi:hypothetical protein